MAKKQIKRWYVRRVAKFLLPMEKLPELQKTTFGFFAITHEGLKALEQAKKGSK